MQRAFVEKTYPANAFNDPLRSVYAQGFNFAAEDAAPFSPRQHSRYAPQRGHG
jgi:hypothetical protein